MRSRRPLSEPGDAREDGKEWRALPFDSLCEKRSLRTRA